MKRTAVYLSFLLAAVCFASPAGTESEQVVVSNVQGSPMILRNGQPIPATAGMACQKYDVLKTTEGCVVDISVNNLAGCRILPSSECAIMETKEESMHLKIKNGNAVFHVGKLGAKSSFKVETPTAIAAVRGTQFWGRVDLQRSYANQKVASTVVINPVTTFAVREGVVEVHPNPIGEKFTLQPGQALDIPKDVSVSPSIRPALAEEMQAMEQASTIKTAA